MEGKGKGRERKRKGRKEKCRKRKGEGREIVPTFWYKMTPKSASDMCYALLLFTVLMNE